MRKFIAALTVIVMVLGMLNQPSVQAASTIKIIIDGRELSTDQAPIILGNYTFVPLRGIFEALNANVDWNSVTKTITAKKADTTIVLKIGSNTATINNQVVPLQSPARILNNRTLVPIRFVSESFGAGVSWNEKTRIVQVTKPAIKQVAPASAVNAIIVGQNGDGRDIQITFTPPSDTSSVKHYRALVVKEANASSMNLAKAQVISSANYSEISTATRYPLLKLTNQSKDVDGALIVANQAYKVFILTVGNDAYALSSPSPTIIVTKAPSLNAATNVSANDISDNGDSRDLQISFTRAVDESQINSYRVFVVREADYTKFNSLEASKVSSGRYQDLPRTGISSYSQALSYNLKDVKGNSITNGVAYRIFVVGVASNGSTTVNELSVPSTSITLVNKGISNISNLTVSDVNDYNNGLDLRIDFTRNSNESNLSHYRIFVVREANASSFTLSSANAVTNSNYYTNIPITGNSISRILSADSRDVGGAIIQNGISYRVFVMSVGSGNLSGTNVLSASSPTITLSNNSSTVVTNISVSDISNYNSGLDLRVDFSRASIESNIDHYRILVVKDIYSSGFNLASANNVTNSNNYTVVPKTGSNISRVLSSNSRDVNGDLIQNGLTYRVYVMSIGGGNSNGINVLSAPSSTITLINTSVLPVTNLTVSDVSNNNNGSDLQVGFNKAADESNVSQYRIFVVKNTNAGSFNLATANSITSNYYTAVTKTGSNISRVLATGALDVNGASVQNNVAYRIFVMTVGGGNSSGINVLSAQSSAITLTNTSVAAVTNLNVSDVSNNNNGSDLQVAFNKAADESIVNQYRIFVVKNTNAASFNLAAANSINSNNYTAVAKTGSNISRVLATGALDVNGASVQNNVAYRIFVMTVGGGNSSGINVLSAQSSAITLTNTSVAAVTNLNVSDVSNNNNGSDLQVAFNKAADESIVSQYRIFVVKDTNAASFNLSTANSINSNNYTAVTKTGNNISRVLATGALDVNGASVQNNVAYRIFVMTVGGGNSSGINVLSAQSSAITLINTNVPAVTNVIASDVSDNNNGSDLQIAFTKASDESNISQYRVFVVKEGNAASFNLTMANAISSNNYTVVAKTGSNISQVLPSGAVDVNGLIIQNNIQYRIFVLSIASNSAPNALSTASNNITLTSVPVVPAPIVTDVAAVQIGIDNELVKISFNLPGDESYINHYAVLLVPVVAPSNGALSGSEATDYVSSGKYTRVEKAVKEIILTGLNQDVIGAPLALNTQYQVYVMSVADGTIANQNTLSTSSASVTLAP